MPQKQRKSGQVRGTRELQLEAERRSERIKAIGIGVSAANLLLRVLPQEVKDAVRDLWES